MLRGTSAKNTQEITGAMTKVKKYTTTFETARLNTMTRNRKSPSSSSNSVVSSFQMLMKKTSKKSPTSIEVHAIRREEHSKALGERTKMRVSALSHSTRYQRAAQQSS